jgi:hypothetical protein
MLNPIEAPNNDAIFYPVVYPESMNLPAHTKRILNLA